MDEAHAQGNVQELQDLLAKTASKSKHKKEKLAEQRITFQNLKDYPYIMWQSAWELDWDKVKGLYDFHFGIPVYIWDDAILEQ